MLPSITCLSHTSYCLAQFLTHHGLVLVCDPGVGDPWLNVYKMDHFQELCLPCLKVKLKYFYSDHRKHPDPAHLWMACTGEEMNISPSGIWWKPGNTWKHLWALFFFFFFWGGGRSLERWCFSRGASGKEPTCQYRRHKRCGFDPWVRKIPWRRKWQNSNPLQYSCWRIPWTKQLGGLPSPWGSKESDTTETTGLYYFTPLGLRLCSVKKQAPNLGKVVL